MRGRKIMITRGEYRDPSGTYGAVVRHTKAETEIILVEEGIISSAFKINRTGEYSFINKKAKEMYTILHKGIRGCTAKNGVATPFVFGTSVTHKFIRTKIEYSIELYNNELSGAHITSETNFIQLEYYDNDSIIPTGIPYIKLTTSQIDIEAPENDADSVVVRSIEEIALEKEDVSWLKNKKYYIVNDDAQAEALFQYLDNYNGVIAYDTETTGLRINCFGKINSSYQRELIKWNEENPDTPLRADKLVGIIFCVENDVSYYFPCFNRRFKNLYEDLNSSTRQTTVQNIKAKYTVGELRNKQGDMAEYIRNTPTDEWTPDIILMERCRNILETKHLVAHNGAFEWKCGWLYEIDTNIKDDTMILHQIMYKFRSTTSNRGEPSNLKYLAKVELGIEQWELGDFFPDFKENTSGIVRNTKSKGKKAGSNIDFSYMTYEGTRIYAPTDGDVTYQLFMKYKHDLVTNHKEQEYIYSVEVIVSQAIGYMEFYGHRIDEKKIYEVRDRTRAEIIMLESEIRQMIEYSSDEEKEVYLELSNILKETEGKRDVDDGLRDIIIECVDRLEKAIKENTDNVLNLNSPAQVSDLFYVKLEIPYNGEKMSVAKKEIKSLLKAKDDEGNNKYPIVHLYSEYKNKVTLMTKFFDNLPNFMYPGGIIFSSYGQISTATGRMSCSKPNAQQYPKAVTNIVSARKGHIMMSADYSQIEYRVLVALSGEEFLARLFEDPDNDYHTLMASLMYGVPYASVTPKMRGDAKSFNFGIPYGMGLGSLAILLTGVNNQSTREEAAEKYELYFRDQPKTRKFFDQVKEMAQVNKYTKTFWNRYRYYSFVDKDGKENNARKAMALRQAGNAIIQGTAADIFKIAVARNWMFIRNNDLIGKFLIVNMIHDEILFEIDVQNLNAQKIIAEVGKNMQFKVNGFPPLFIGAGLGHTWTEAKGKMAEIHPWLLDQLTDEASEMSILRDNKDGWKDTGEIVDYFNERIYEFRKQQVINYISNPDNFHKDIHPAIGNLLNLQFTFGHSKEKEGYNDIEFTSLCLKEFINHYSVEGVTADLFKVIEQDKDIVEDNEYDDGDEDTDLLDGSDYLETNFALIDESDVVFGTDIHDIIKTFGSVVAPHLKVCGIDTRKLNYKTKDAITDFLMDHLCESTDNGAMQIVFLNESNVLNNTGLWVKGIDGSEVEKRLRESGALA